MSTPASPLFHFSFVKSLGATWRFQNPDSSQNQTVVKGMDVKSKADDFNKDLHICQCIASSRNTAQCNACGQSHHLGFSSHTPKKHTKKDLSVILTIQSQCLDRTCWYTCKKYQSRSQVTWYSRSGFTHFGLQDSSRYFFGSTTSSSALKWSQNERRNLKIITSSTAKSI